ncbi:hypothetical protein TIFTF001_029929 [Ficus carica]|uniref:Uncharacterized protein n=1 Tax=Ficus carica TaxID=3494 RepID=A0AA88DSS0_FICCA|nr:hypothetical protein TIFTF001_029929 [Ficus carica]
MIRFFISPTRLQSPTIFHTIAFGLELWYHSDGDDCIFSGDGLSIFFIADSDCDSS